MRMWPRDLSDVTGAAYKYMRNGHATADSWNVVVQPGEKIRLRIINASAMTLCNFRIPGLPMTVGAADGLNLQPVETDEFQIGVAETYDVIITPAPPMTVALRSSPAFGRCGCSMVDAIASVEKRSIF